MLWRNVQTQNQLSACVLLQNCTHSVAVMVSLMPKMVKCCFLRLVYSSSASVSIVNSRFLLVFLVSQPLPWQFWFCLKDPTHFWGSLSWPRSAQARGLSFGIILCKSWNKYGERTPYSFQLLPTKNVDRLFRLGCGPLHQETSNSDVSWQTPAYVLKQSCGHQKKWSVMNPQQSWSPRMNDR